MTPEQINQAIRDTIPDGAEPDLSALQIVMLGPELAEVKVRLVADGNWYQHVAKVNTP